MGNAENGNENKNKVFLNVTKQRFKSKNKVSVQARRERFLLRPQEQQQQKLRGGG